MTEETSLSLRLQYTAEASEFYRQKMMDLINHDYARRHDLRGYVPNGKGGTFVELPATLMYRIDTLKSADGHRLYEFLIEYDIDTPCTGIYYGCRGITIEGYDHAKEIEQFRKEREIVLPEMCQILNNTFPLKDFSHRFKLTDNVNDNTYWLFWITLNEEEDIKKVGITATTILRNVFRRYLNGEQLLNTPLPQKHLEKAVTCFTHDTYRALLQQIRYVDGQKKEDKQKTADARELFEKFIIGAEHQRILAVDSNYECAWRVMLKNVDFVRMIYAFFSHLYQLGLINKSFRANQDDETIEIPWAHLQKVFLDQDGKAYTQALRTQLNQLKQQSTLENDIVVWIRTIQDCIKNA